MKLPWVSRDRLEVSQLLVGWLQGMLKLANESTAEERKRVKELTDKMLAMRKEGYEPVHPDVEKEIDPLPPEIRAVIKEVADVDEWLDLETYALNEIGAGTKYDAIINTIIEGLPFQA